MRPLVIGASGLVGSHLMRALVEAGITAVGTYWSHPALGLVQLDARDAEAVRSCLAGSGADTVFLPAALTNVDYCETHPDDSLVFNVNVVSNVASTGARVIYFSSDYVFAGDAGPYRETDSVRPINVYGSHKALAERLLPPGSLIIRTTVVYGQETQRKNFVYRLVQGLTEGETMHVPVDQLGNPTYAPNLARAAVALAQQGAAGIYHVVGPRRASRYEFALEAAHVFGLNPALIEPVTTEQLKQPARRPLNAGMVSERAQACIPFDLIDHVAGLRLFRQLIETEGGL